jgi:hypothetical protein
MVRPPESCPGSGAARDHVRSLPADVLICACEGRRWRVASSEPMMLTDDEKARIVERVQYERALKETLDPKKASRWAPLESKLGLVIIGFILTGVLVPALQYFQETIKWERQNRYENIKYRLGLMRQCLSEYVLLSAFTSEAYLKAEPVISHAGALGPKERAEYLTQRIELQNRRFQQNAKVSALFVHFRAKDMLDKEFRSYLKEVSAYMAQLDSAVDRPRGRGAPPSTAIEGVLHDLDVRTLELNEVYERVLAVIRKELSEVENESQSFM